MFKKALSFMLSMCVIGSTFALFPQKAEAAVQSKLAANSQVLVLQSDGRIFGWGDNSYGQLGIGDQKITNDKGQVQQGSSVSAVYTPVEITYFKNNGITVKDIYCAQNTSYVVDTNGKLYSAGDNTKGQCGIGSTTAQCKTWTKVPTVGNSSYSVGRLWCAYDTVFVENLKSELLCVFGSNESGQDGTGIIGDKRVPYEIPNSKTTNIADIYMGKSNSVIRMIGNTSNFYSGKVGNSNTDPTLTGGITAVNSTVYPSTSGRVGDTVLVGGAQQVSKFQPYCYFQVEKKNDSCGVPSCHSPEVNNQKGTFPDKLLNPPLNGNGISQSLAVGVNGVGSDMTWSQSNKCRYNYYHSVYYYFYGGRFGSGVSQVKYTGDRMICKDSNNDVYTAGLTGAKGALGTNNTATKLILHTSLNSARASKNATVNKLVAFNDVNYMTLNDSKKTMYSNGDNSYGQLGIGKTPSQLASSPAAHEVDTLSGKGVVDVQSDGYSTIALCGNGDIYTWGNNAYGFCGQGTDSSSIPYFTTPTLLASFKYIEGATPPSAVTGLTVPLISYVGDTVEVIWNSAGEGIKYIVEVKRDGGTWEALPRVTSNKVSLNVDKICKITVRVASENDFNLVSPWTTSPEVSWKARPTPPASIRVSPEYVQKGEEITITWASTGVVGVYQLQRSIDGGAWAAVTTGNVLEYKEPADEFWTNVKYRVCWKPSASSVEASSWVESKPIRIAQVLDKPSLLKAPGSVNVGDEIKLEWSDPENLGDYSFNLYRSTDNSSFTLIEEETSETTYTDIGDLTWGKVQYAVTCTDGFAETEQTMSGFVTIIGGTGGDKGDGGISGDDLADIIGGIIGGGGGGSGQIIDGIAISTLKQIANLKQTVFGSTGITVKGKFKSYEQLSNTGYDGYSEGLALPVQYQGTEKNLMVTGKLTFGGREYPIHWGDFEGPTEIKNITGTVNGYVFVPKADMTTNDPKLPCKLYVQDATEAYGVPRMSYQEVFEVGVDMENPKLEVDLNGEAKSISVKASDDVTGINRVSYRYKSTGTTSWSTEMRVPDTIYGVDGDLLSFTRNGKFIVKVAAYDNAGNVSEFISDETKFGSGVDAGESGSGGGIGEIETPDSSGMLPGDINVFRQSTPTFEIVIINGKQNDNSSFDRKTLEEIFK